MENYVVLGPGGSHLKLPAQTRSEALSMAAARGQCAYIEHSWGLEPLPPMVPILVQHRHPDEMADK